MTSNEHLPMSKFQSLINKTHCPLCNNTLSGSEIELLYCNAASHMYSYDILNYYDYTHKIERASITINNIEYVAINSSKNYATHSDNEFTLYCTFEWKIILKLPHIIEMINEDALQHKIKTILTFF